MGTAGVLSIAFFGTMLAYLVAVVVIIVRIEQKAAFKARVDYIVSRWSKVGAQ